jgi:ABC-type uncharacterized transport system permease subunit
MEDKLSGTFQSQYFFCYLLFWNKWAVAVGLQRTWVALLIAAGRIGPKEEMRAQNSAEA